ncbi:extracellular solute-binding protein [Methylocystis heyeri]|uniref:ABC transporter substrate-binding protein n=1 Tax=Methylocystis heyeri TaxID=391905 RepID=A0A6B8KF07_9HYPH|nr:extracellular solute-binding protein [Methylocystis heyeri]QGM46202.1 ABC transporter substrate-binding protein [Methylocystis heyeri]
MNEPLLELPLSRRRLFGASAAVLAFLASRKGLAAPPEAGGTESHGLSIFGDLAEKPDFKQFGYVNPQAPKGGTLVMEPPPPETSTYDSLNAYILRGNPAAGVGLIFDTLMTGSLDERDALYGLVAHKVQISADKLTYTFFLRKEARFHDGSPLTAHDAAFSLNILKSEGHPMIAQSLRDVVSAEATTDDVLVVKLAPERTRELPIIVATQPIFSKEYYSKHKFSETTMEPPLGSSAYRIGKFEPGRYISFDRVPDYWAKDLPVNVGQANFETIRYEYFGDRNVAFEAFKSGVTTVHEEFTSAVWATGYDFPAIRDGRVKREVIPDENISGTQGWYLNTRRPVFKDRRVREALIYAFDFEWTNHNLFHDSYERTTSYFEHSDLKAEGQPSEAEKALLEPFRDKLPAEVFGAPFRPPVSDGSGQDRNLLRKASELLAAAGCKRKDGVLYLPDGNPFKFEFLDFSSFYERITQPYIKNLKLLGIQATQRIVDSAQYKRRTDDFDYDVRTERLRIAYSPGEELRILFGSEAAKTPGSQNLSGIDDPVVDALIAKALVAASRSELATICRALDRVLIAGRYWIPHWYKPTHWIAHWDVFGRPERYPRFEPGIASTWWWDEDRARKINFTTR